MTKYRIISEPGLLNPEDLSIRWYVAQYKSLNLFWVNCFPDFTRPGDVRSLDIKAVERYIESLINDERIDLSKKVVKVYE